MKKFCILSLVAFAMLAADAKVMIYKGTSSNWSSCVATYCWQG